MSNVKLPQSVTVRKLVDSSARLSGQVTPERLPRVASAVSCLDSSFHVVLVFGLNEVKKSKIDVQINGDVGMQCQRCLMPVSVKVDIETTLTVVAHDEEARSQIRDYEPILLDEGMLDIDVLVEEEILLGLPLVAMHPESINSANVAGVESCSAENNRTANIEEINSVSASESVQEIERRSEAGMDNPFDALKTLKTADGQEQL